MIATIFRVEGFYHKAVTCRKIFLCERGLRETVTGSLAVAILIAAILGCGLRGPVNESGDGNLEAKNSAGAYGPDADQRPSAIVSPDDAAEISVTAEEIYAEYKDEKNSEAEKKYFNKTLAVEGRFNDIDVSKKDPSGGYRATLQAGGFLDWVICSVDENAKNDFEQLKTDQLITVKGLGDRYWIGGPRLKHCVLAEGP
jgi:hypothetical protein